MLDTKAGVPQAANVPVGNNLALPPDLQLAVPAATSSRYQPNGYVAPITMPAPRPVSQAASFADPNAGRAPLQQQGMAGKAPLPGYSPSDTIYINQTIDLANPGDYYAKYGISRFKANGQLKTKEQLRKELIDAVMAKKRQTNPNYGTVANMGNLGPGGDSFIMQP